VKSPKELERQVRFVLFTAEWVLGRPVKTVLDVGCGEGNWRAVLRRLRPGIAYEGIDPSAYAVERFGKARNIRRGGIEDVESVARRDEYDLVVCCGMLNYLDEQQLRSGIGQVASKTGGVAYLELFTSDDAFEGDTSWPDPRSTNWYRRLISKTGLHSIGLHCYIPAHRVELVASLERA
jgi:SAM-dependent methyltransferase